MPKVGWDFIRYVDPDTDFDDAFKVDFNVDTQGVFYCYPREDVYKVIDGDEQLRASYKAVTSVHRKRHGVVGANTLSNLKKLLNAALKKVCTPVVTEELVIEYNIESHVSFAEQPDGTIVPNTSWPDAAWADGAGRDDQYGGHHSQRPAEGGYSLIVGARAYRKIAKDFGGSKEVFYELYYGKDEDGEYLGHFEKEHPAGLLNSWASFSFDGGRWGNAHPTKEMPYTDKAALFFHRLMLGMAEMQRQIQTMVADEQKFIEFANSGRQLLANTEKEDG